MQTDFKEERKWKLAIASAIADEIKRWHRCDNVARARMTVGGRMWGEPYRNEVRNADGIPLGDEAMQGLNDLAADSNEADTVLQSLQDQRMAAESSDAHVADEKPVIQTGPQADDMDMDAEGEEDAEGERDDDEETDENGALRATIGNADIEMGMSYFLRLFDAVVNEYFVV